MKTPMRAYMSALFLVCFGFSWGQTEVGTSTHKTVATASFSFSDNEAAQKYVPNASVTISTSGRPVFVAIVPQVPNSAPDWQPYSISLIGESKAHPFSSYAITILRDSKFAVVTGPGYIDLSDNDPGTLELPYSINAIDSPKPGPHVYAVRVSGTQGKIEIKGARLVAYEM